MTVRLAVVRTRFIAYHRWPDAPDGVDFLREKHRHEFHVELAVAQEHNDRDVEFIMLRRWLDLLLEGEYNERFLGEMSCEMMAETLLNEATREGYTPSYCTVFEDGENGAALVMPR